MDLVLDPHTGKPGFYGNYTGGIIVYQLDRQRQRVFVQKLDEVYPTSIDNIALSYDSTDTVSEVTVNFIWRPMRKRLQTGQVPTFSFIPPEFSLTDPIGVLTSNKTILNIRGALDNIF